MTFKEFYSELVFKKIKDIKVEKVNQIFVLVGQTNLLELDNKLEFIADFETFNLNTSEDVFNKDWFAKIFTILNQPKEYHLLSFAQFSYLINYIDPSFFSERVCLLKDNLRQLFPIEKFEYLEKDEKENIEFRSENLPIYQAEQVVINEKYYYSLKTPLNSFNSVEIFADSKELSFSSNQDLWSIDVSSDPHSLDGFVNSCIEQNDFTKQAVVKLYSRQPLNPTILDILEKLNSILKKFGGALFILEEPAISSDYRVSSRTKEMLFKFWGETASFRDILVFKNPNINNEITKVSQGLVVETITSRPLKSI